MNLPTLVVIHAALIGVWLASGLFTLWISSRSWHWFLRLLILIISVIPLIAIEALDLMLAVLVCNLTMFFPIAYFCRRPKPNRDSQSSSGQTDSPQASQLVRWGIMDLLLGTALIAIVVTQFQVDLSKQQFSLLATVLFGCLSGTILLLGVAAIYGPWNWRRRAIICIGLLVVAVMLSFAFGKSDVLNGQTMTALNSGFVSYCKTIPLVAGAFMLATLGAFRFQRGSWKPKPLQSIFWDRVRWVHFSLSQLLIAALVIPCLASLPWVYSKLLVSYPVVAESNLQGDQNGFLELVAAGKTFSQSNILEGTTLLLPGPRIRQEVQRYESEFAQVKTALSRDLLTAKTWTDSNPSPLIVGGHISETRSIARALDVKARQEIHDGNFDIAMSDGCSCVKLRIPLSRSGIIIDALLGLALESTGLTPIHNATSDASVEKLQQALALLQEMDAMPDDAHGICQQERETFWHHSNWTYRLFLLGMEDVHDGIAVQLDSSFRQHRASRRQLITCLALEMFYRDLQRYPEQLGDLVPKYLDSVPLDPYTTTDSSEALSLRYTLQEKASGPTALTMAAA